MTREQPTVDLEEVTCLYDSGMALKIEFKGEEYWIPKSLISEYSEVTEEGDEGTLVIPEWLAEEKGLV